MFNILETVNNYSDTWRITFYFVAALAILISLFWTLFKMFKQDGSKQNKLKENLIYNKSYDVIENQDNLKKKNVDNHYDVYQTLNKKEKDNSN